MTLTVAQILNFLAIVAGAIGSISVIYAAAHKLISKKIDGEIEEAMRPISDSLEEIKQQNEALKAQGEETRKEVILMMKLNQSMVTEMKTLGHINGETTAALQELNDYLINK